MEEKEGYALTLEASFGDFFNLYIHTSVTTHPILKIEKKKFSFSSSHAKHNQKMGENV